MHPNAHFLHLTFTSSTDAIAHFGTAALSVLNTNSIHLLTIKMQVASNLLHILHFINTCCKAVLSSADNKLVATEVTIAYGTETKNKLIIFFKKKNISEHKPKNLQHPQTQKNINRVQSFSFPSFAGTAQKYSSLGLICFT